MKRLKRFTAFLLCFCMVWNLSIPQTFAMSRQDSAQRFSGTGYSVATDSDAEKDHEDNAGDEATEGGNEDDDSQKGEVETGDAAEDETGNGSIGNDHAGNKDSIDTATSADATKEPVTATAANAAKLNKGLELSIINNNDYRPLPIQIGTTYQLKVEVTPEDETEYQLVFKSSDPSAATVDENGLIRAVSMSGAYIYITVAIKYTDGSDGNSAEMSVNVINQEPCLITLHANGGTFDDETVEKQIYTESDVYFNFPNVSNGDKNLRGWYADSDCSQLVEENDFMYPKKSMELYAGWVDNYTITYDLGGYGDQGSMKTEYTVGQGMKIGNNYPYVPAGPSEETHDKMFAGWLTPDGKLYPANDIRDYIPAGNETITAQWVDYYTISYDYNGVRDNNNQESSYECVIPGNKLKNRPSFPSGRPEDTNNKMFAGWKNSEGKLLSDSELRNYVPKGNEILTAQWSDYYVITFDYNGVKYGGESSRTENVMMGDNVSAPYMPDNPAQTDGKMFVGWKIPSGDILDNSQIDRYKPSGSETITAQWSEYYTITFDYNGVTYNGQTKQTKWVAKGQSLESHYVYMPDNPDQTEGRMFVGWKNGAGDEISANDVRSYIPVGDEVLTAQWSEQYYTVTFDYNGVTIDNKTKSVGYAVPGKAVTNYPYISSDPSVTGGKVLVGWEISGKLISGDDLYRYIPSGNETLTAKWTEETIKITFDYNGVKYSGKVSESIQVIPGRNIGYHVPSFSNNPANTQGKLLKNWESNGKLYTSDEIVKLVPEGPMTFTAQWTNEYYTVTFDYNGIKYNGKFYEEKAVIPGKRINTTPGIPTEPYEAYDRVLIGWQNAAGELFSNNEISSYVPSGDETLTARWSSYVIVTYDTDGGILNGNSAKEYVPAGEAIKRGYEPTKKGFLFAGWYDKKNGRKAENNKYVPTGNVTLTAKWQEFYTITYDANGGGYTYDSYMESKVIKGEAVYLNDDYGYSKEGFTLEGWCEDKECKGTVLTGNYVPDKDITLYAKWTSYYTVTLDPGIGTLRNENTMKVVKGKSLGYLSEPDCSEAAFGGWYLDEALTQAATRAYVPKADITLYAKWNFDTYQVTFHAGGAWLYDGKNYTSELVKKVVKNQPLSVKNISDNRNNYECTWYLDQDYKTPFNWASAIESDLDLYAVWSKRVTVFWDADGGSDTSMKKNGSFYVGQGESRSLPNVTKEGYALTGWVTDSGEKVTNQTKFYENTYIKAQWEAGYQVTLDLKGGVLYYNDYYKPVFYVKKGQSCGYKPTPTKAGNAFLGWVDESGNDIGKLSSYIPVRDTTLTAQWSDDYITVRFHMENDTIYDDATGEDVQLLERRIPRNKSYVDATGGSLDSPEKVGNAFIGWSLKAGGTEVIDLSTYQFTADADLYPVWGECWYIGVEAMGGFINGTIDQHTRGYEVVKGKELRASALMDHKMTKPGYRFDGWYDNTEFTGTRYRVPFTPAGNMTLYAKWEEDIVKKYTVSFDTAGGSAIESVQIGEGSKLTRPQDPEKEGGVFEGWYQDSEYLHLYYFTEPVYKDITLYAKWMETNDVNDASITINGEYTYTGALIIPEVTVKIGNKTLVKDTDYSVSGGGTNAGYATVTITGINSYTGVREVGFKILKADIEVKVPEGPFTFTYGQKFKEVSLPDGWKWKNPESTVGDAGKRQAGIIYAAADANHKDQTALVEIIVEPLSLSDAVITLYDADKIEYDGNPKEPVIQSVTLNGVTLQAGAYQVSYENNTDPGTATVIIIGKGNYKDTASVGFTIGKGDPELIIGKLPLEAVYGSKLKDITLPDGWTWQKPDTSVGGVSTENKTFLADYKASADSKYKDKKDVLLKVHVIPRTIKGSEVVLAEPPYVLGDRPVEPEVTVVCDGVTLTANQDYKVTYDNNDQVGRAKAVVSGMGNYDGIVTKEFDIIDDPYDLHSAKITLSPSSAVYTGSEIKPDTIVVIAPVTLVKDTDYTVEYSNNVEPGEADVVVKGKGDYHGSQTVHFFIDPEKYEVKAVYGTKLLAYALPAGWEWKNSDSYVGDATETGRLFPAVYTSGSTTKEASFKVIVKPKSITDQTVKINIDRSHLVYTGSELRPEVTIMDNVLDETLKESEDYQVTCSNNTDAGQAGVRIEGVQNYTGSFEDQFTIDQADPKPEMKSDKIEDQKIHLTIKEEPFFLYASHAGDGEIVFTSGDDTVITVEKKVNEFEEPDGFLTVKGLGETTLTVEVPETKNYKAAKLIYMVEVVPVTLADSDIKLEKTSYPYTGEQIKPVFTVVSNGITLKEGTDYTVSYGPNIKAGADAGSVTVTGQGDYKGTVSATFTIRKVENPAEVPASAEAVYGQKLGEILLTGEWKWAQPQSYVGNVGENSHEVVLAETDNYLEKTGNTMVTVSAKTLTESMLTLEYTETEYDGTAKEPKVMAEDAGLITENDYRTEYSRNTELGEAIVTITGQGNYVGTVEKKFTIIPAVLKESEVSVSETFIYDGTPKTPEPVVMAGDKLLIRDTDYEVAYEENVNAGKGKAVVTGKGYYQGTVTVLFTIEKAEPTVATPSELKAVYGSRVKEVELPEHYSWSDGEAYVGSVGEKQLPARYTSPDPNYKDLDVTLTVTVEKRALKAEDFMLEKLSYVYDGTAKTPAVKALADYLKAEDYQISYEQNNGAGTAYAMITGTGNTMGWVKLPYLIEKATPVITVGAGTEITRYVTEGKFALDASVTDERTIVYTSSDSSVATVDEEGTVAPVRAGTVIITITCEGDSNYYEAKAEVTVILKRSGSSGGNSSGGSSSGGSSGGSSVKHENTSYSAVPQGYTGPTKVIDGVTVPEYVTEGTWTQTADGHWKFMDKSGTPYAGSWVPAYNAYADPAKGQSVFNWFLFDKEGNMITGWYTDENGATFYLNPVSDNTLGSMVTGWRLIDGKWYYFNEVSDGTRGKLLKDTVTPDGYYVNQDGVWDGNPKK